jgi:predicted O-methyltransferase YrrM
MRIRHHASRLWHRSRRTLNFFRDEALLEEYQPRGHYYSPLPDIEFAAEFSRGAMRRAPAAAIPGVRLDLETQKPVIDAMLSVAAGFDWPDRAAPERRFFNDNRWFDKPDAFTLYAVMQTIKPARIIEIGSGFSSALMLDTRQFKAMDGLNLSFIEPEPMRLRTLLREGDSSAADILEQYVQNVPLSFFESLTANDILFVDSSHVSRVGSDLNHMLFEILPRLASGVWIHFHDIFWPFEYPESWLKKGISWNEAYLLRAFLMYNSSFDIAFWPAWAAGMDARIPAQLSQFHLDRAQSIWLRRR